MSVCCWHGVTWYFVPIQLSANSTKSICNKRKQKLYCIKRETYGHNILWGYNASHTLQKVILHKPKSAERERPPDPSGAFSFRSHGDAAYSRHLTDLLFFSLYGSGHVATGLPRKALWLLSKQDCYRLDAICEAHQQMLQKICKFFQQCYSCCLQPHEASVIRPCICVSAMSSHAA